MGRLVVMGGQQKGAGARGVCYRKSKMASPERVTAAVAAAAAVKVKAMMRKNTVQERAAKVQWLGIDQVKVFILHNKINI